MIKSEIPNHSAADQGQSEAPAIITSMPNQADAAVSTVQKGQPIPRGPNLKLNTKQQVDLLSICVRNKGGFVVGGVGAFWKKVTKELGELHDKSYQPNAITRIGTTLGNGLAKEPQEATIEWGQMYQAWAGVFARGPQRTGHLAIGGGSRQPVSDWWDTSHEELDASGPSERKGPFRLSTERRKRSATPEPLPREGKRRLREAITLEPKAKITMEEISAQLQVVQTQLAEVLKGQSEFRELLKACRSTDFSSD